MSSLGISYLKKARHIILYFDLFPVPSPPQKGWNLKGKKNAGIISFLLFCLLEPEQTEYI